MTFRVFTEQRPAANLNGTVIVLSDPASQQRAEVWPALGFNCFRWSVAGSEILYADPHLFESPVPTRSGFPILFPFPNRIRDGRFSWDGRNFSLPLNDPAKKNAIHGFACRRPWRLIDRGADETSAWVTAEFDSERDAADMRDLWPGDYRLVVSYRLFVGRLRVTAEVRNPGRQPLPFGLGYHPYFRVPFRDAPGADCWVEAPARSFWELRDNLPTGVRQPVDALRDLNQPRRFDALTLDDVLTDLAPHATAQGLLRLGQIGQAPDNLVVSLWASPAFRELVVFTPPHRQAICLEPYTCTTDAINLQARGIDAGLQRLEPGQRWSAVVELQVTSNSQATAGA